jgi:exonuclease SbcD
MASVDASAVDVRELFARIEDRISGLVEAWMSEADPGLPLILTAHASVEGAMFGAERMVMLGSDLVLPTSLVKDRRLDYVAMGHIHKPQDLNEGNHPPVIYPGSIERIDFGEARDGTRPFIERRTSIESTENVTEHLIRTLPAPDKMIEAIVKLTVEYPREMDVLIDETALRKYTECCFEFHLIKRPKSEARVRIPEGQTVSSLGPLELLSQYFEASKIQDSEELQQLAHEIITGDSPDL